MSMVGLVELRNRDEFALRFYEAKYKNDGYSERLDVEAAVYVYEEELQDLYWFLLKSVSRNPTKGEIELKDVTATARKGFVDFKFWDSYGKHHDVEGNLTLSNKKVRNLSNKIYTAVLL